MVTMNISITPSLANFVKSQVDGGLYGNASEVMRDALRNMHFMYQSKLEFLRRELATRVKEADAGDFSNQTIDEIFLEVKNAKKAKQNKL